jgi:hypothetical protein
MSQLKNAHRRAWQDFRSFPGFRTGFNMMYAFKQAFISMALCFAPGAHCSSLPGVPAGFDAAEPDAVVERAEHRLPSRAGEDMSAWLLARRDLSHEKSPGQDQTQGKKSPDSRTCRVFRTRVTHSERYAREARTEKLKRFHEAEAIAWQKKYDAECAP